LIFVTPYDLYSPLLGGDEESVLEILADAKSNDYIYSNFHPKNLMYDSGHNLKIIDIGRSLEPYNENGYQNMIRRAYIFPVTLPVFRAISPPNIATYDLFPPA
jgi:hypothetical protein